MKTKTVLLLGATGTIGRATCAELLAQGHAVLAPVRPASNATGLPQHILREASAEDVLHTEPVDAVMSCIASRTGLDAWEVDYSLNRVALNAATAAGVSQFILLSAICVQKPALAFQRAKLAFEAELQAASLTWSIVRPTAFFKSLSGQVERLRSGKSFVVFGDGTRTACKPISDQDTARYLVQCLNDPALQNRVLPVGGPGPAITPRAQGEMLFDALNLPPRFSHVPVTLMRAVIFGLACAGAVSKKAREKAELARIGHYYATESMLFWDAETKTYQADKTPEFGQDLLSDYYRALINGDIADDRGDHAVF